jgi:hypothetical protein
MSMGTADDGVPSGASILGPSISAPEGYRYTGAYLGNLDANLWTARAAMPAPAAAQCAAAVAADQIYVTGGFGR